MMRARAAHDLLGRTVIPAASLHVLHPHHDGSGQGLDVLPDITRSGPARAETKSNVYDLLFSPMTHDDPYGSENDEFRLQEVDPDAKIVRTSSYSPEADEDCIRNEPPITEDYLEAFQENAAQSSENGEVFVKVQPDDDLEIPELPDDGQETSLNTLRTVLDPNYVPMLDAEHCVPHSSHEWQSKQNIRVVCFQPPNTLPEQRFIPRERREEFEWHTQGRRNSFTRSHILQDTIEHDRDSRLSVENLQLAPIKRATPPADRISIRLPRLHDVLFGSAQPRASTFPSYLAPMSNMVESPSSYASSPSGNYSNGSPLTYSRATSTSLRSPTAAFAQVSLTSRNSTPNNRVRARGSGGSSDSNVTRYNQLSPATSSSTVDIQPGDRELSPEDDDESVSTLSRKDSGQDGEQSAQGVVYRCKHEGCKAPPFATQYLLNSHGNVHSSDRPHFCMEPGCKRGPGGKGFKRKNEMIRHQLVHNSPGYICPYCPDDSHQYPRPDNLQRHVTLHHKDKDKSDQELRDVLARKPPGMGSGTTRRRRVPESQPTA